jgi:predicted phage terminase large subunit-like protein
MQKINPNITMPTTQAIKGELARRTQLYFMQYLWQVRSRPMVVGYHTQKICDRLDKAIEDFRNGKSTYLIVKVPFRHGKSDIISRYFPPRFLGLFPDEEIIVAAYTSSLVEGFSRFARNIMLDERYRAVFPGVKLSSTDASVKNWGVEGRQGQARWVGIRGSITGKGGSLAIVDDFFKGREEAESSRIRDKVWESIEDDIRSRLAPVHIMIILATPWHIDDPFGRIARNMKENPDFPKFEELKFPARSDVYPSGYLFPERYSLEWYRGQFARPAYSVAGLLQCEPIGREGAFFKTDRIEYIQPAQMPRDIVYCRGWDLASTKKTVDKEDPDYTVGIKLGVRWQQLPNGEKIPTVYIDDMVRGRWDAPQRDKTIKATAIADGAITIGVEAFGGYKDCYTTLSNALHGLRVVKKLQLPGDKRSKWEVLQAAFEAGNVYLKRASWNTDFLEEVGLVPGAAHDDIADAMVVAYETHAPNIAHVWSIYNGETMSFAVNFANLSSHSKLICSQWVEDDFTTSIILAMWNANAGQLWVYCEVVNPTSMPDIVVPVVEANVRSVSKGHLKTMQKHTWLGSPLMFAAKTNSSSGNYTKDSMSNGYLKKKINIVDNIGYDEPGSITLISQMIFNKLVIINSRCGETARQMSSWIIEAGRPAAKGFGLCRALCNAVGYLKERGHMEKTDLKLESYSIRKTNVLNKLNAPESVTQTKAEGGWMV